MEKVDQPTITDIQLHNGDVKRTTNRTYKCSSCGFIDPFKETKTVSKKELENDKEL